MGLFSWFRSKPAPAVERRGDPTDPVVVFRFDVTVERMNFEMETSAGVDARPEALAQLAGWFEPDLTHLLDLEAARPEAVCAGMALIDGALFAEIAFSFAQALSAERIDAAGRAAEALWETDWAIDYEWGRLPGYDPDEECARLRFAYRARRTASDLPEWARSAPIAPPAPPFAPAARAMEHAGQLEVAFARYNAALDARIDAAEFGYVAAEAAAEELAAGGCPLGAAIAFERAAYLCFDPQSRARFIFARARSLSAAGQHREGIEAVQALIAEVQPRRRPQSAGLLEPLRVLAQLQAAAGERVDAIKTWEQIERIAARFMGPDHARVREARGARATLAEG